MMLDKLSERIHAAYKESVKDGIERYTVLLEVVLEELLTKHEAELSTWGRTEFWSDTAYKTATEDSFTFTYKSCKSLTALAERHGFKLEIIFNSYHGTKIKISVIE